MTLTDAKQLKIGDRVKWTADYPASGRVCEVGDAGLKIQWEDDSNPNVQRTLVGFHWDDVQKVLESLSQF